MAMIAIPRTDDCGPLHLFAGDVILAENKSMVNGRQIEIIGIRHQRVSR